MKIKMLIKNIKSFFVIMRLAARHYNEIFRNCKGYHKTKKDLLKFISDSIGSDWKSVNSIEVHPEYIKVIKHYQK